MFKTAFEIDQRWLIDLAGDRAEFICQSQSLNVFLPADVHKKTLHDIHWQAWKKGVKTLYYRRSRSRQRADVVGNKAEVDIMTLGAAGGGAPVDAPQPVAAQGNENDYDECLACQ